MNGDNEIMKRKFSWRDNKFIKISTIIELGCLSLTILYWILIYFIGATSPMGTGKLYGLLFFPPIFIIMPIIFFLSPINIIVFFIRFLRTDLLDKIFFVTNVIMFIPLIILIEFSHIEGLSFFANIVLLMVAIVVIGIIILLHLRKIRGKKQV